MKLVPLGDKVVVKRLEAEEQTAGGVLLPESAREAPREGRVLSVGDGKMLADGTRAAHQVKEGDRVLFSQWGATEVRIDGEAILVMTEDDILAVLK